MSNKLFWLILLSFPGILYSSQDLKTKQLIRSELIQAYPRGTGYRGQPQAPLNDPKPFCFPGIFQSLLSFHDDKKSAHRLLCDYSSRIEGADLEVQYLFCTNTESSSCTGDNAQKKYQKYQLLFLQQETKRQEQEKLATQLKMCALPTEKTGKLLKTCTALHALVQSQL